MALALQGRVLLGDVLCSILCSEAEVLSRQLSSVRLASLL